MRLIIRDEYEGALLRLGIEDIEGLLKRPEVQVIDDVDKSVVVSLPLGCPHDQERIAIKRYDKPTLKKKLKDIFRVSKAIREWRIGNRLWERSIPVALPLAVGEKRRWRVLKDSLLISREIEGACQLRQYILTFKPPLTAESRWGKREMIVFLAEELRGVHDKGFFHGDLNSSHIMVKRGEGKRPTFYFVDFENSRLGGKVFIRQRVKELARLNESMPDFITRVDKVRFFKVYSKSNELMKRKRKELLKKIERRTLEKANRITTFQ